MEGHNQVQEAPSTLLDGARKMAEIGRLVRKMEEKQKKKYRRTTSGGGGDGGSNKRAAADASIITKPARPGMKLVEVPEDLILQIMWEKACSPRHHNSPAAWKPRPNDPGDEQLSRVYETARAIIRLIHRHIDDVIQDYVYNGCAYEEVQIGDDDE